MRPPPQRTFRFLALDAVTSAINDALPLSKPSSRVLAGIVFALALAREKPEVADRLLTDILEVQKVGVNHLIERIALADRMDLGASDTVDRLRPKAHTQGTTE